MEHNCIQVFEHDILRIGQGGLKKGDLKSLAKFHDEVNSKFFDLVRDGVKFNNHVGVIQTKGLTIEILPKIDKLDDNNKTKWRSVLISMLRECRMLRVESLSNAGLKIRHNSLLELYFEIFLNETETLLHHGLIKQYRHQQNNIKALKGRLNFGQQVYKNLIHKERFYTEHTVYDYEHFLNQVLLAALQVLSRINNSSQLLDRIGTMMLNFPEIEQKTIAEKALQNITYHRKTQAYKPSIEIAKMILLNYRPDIQHGNNDMLAILFDMNRLWEQFITIQLQKNALPGMSITAQNVKKFWYSAKCNQGVSIRPDIHINYQGTNYIIDTKWKLANNNRPSEHDLRQMYTYNLFWKAEKAFLLYPGNKTGIFSGNFYQQDGANQLSKMETNLLFVSIFKDGFDALDENIGTRILGVVLGVMVNNEADV